MEPVYFVYFTRLACLGSRVAVVIRGQEIALFTHKTLVFVIAVVSYPNAVKKWVVSVSFGFYHAMEVGGCYVLLAGSYLGISNPVGTLFTDILGI